MAESKDEANTGPTWGNFSKIFSQRNVANNAPHLIPYIKPDSHIIDVGCGIGSITLDLAQRAPQGFILGIDKDPTSITTAQKTAADLQIPNISFAVADAQDLSDYSSSTFDIAHAHQVMLHLLNPTQSLTHLRRLVKPHTGIVSTRDNAFLNFHPSGPTMSLDRARFIAEARARGAANIGGGCENHVWMHEAGFAWEEMEMGVVGVDVRDREARRGAMEGYVGMAEQRGEGEDFVAELRREWEVCVESAAGRVLALDSWCVGRRGVE